MILIDDSTTNVEVIKAEEDKKSSEDTTLLGAIKSEDISDDGERDTSGIMLDDEIRPT